MPPELGRWECRMLPPVGFRYVKDDSNMIEDVKLFHPTIKGLPFQYFVLNSQRIISIISAKMPTWTTMAISYLLDAITDKVEFNRLVND